MRGCGLATLQMFGGLGLTDALRELIGTKFDFSREISTFSAAAVAETVFVPLAHVRRRLQLDVCRTRQWSSPLHCLLQLVNAAKAQPSGWGMSNIVSVSRAVFRGAIASVFIGTIQKSYFFRLYDTNFRDRDSIGCVPVRLGVTVVCMRVCTSVSPTVCLRIHTGLKCKNVHTKINSTSCHTDLRLQGLNIASTLGMLTLTNLLLFPLSTAVTRLQVFFKPTNLELWMLQRDMMHSQSSGHQSGLVKYLISMFLELEHNSDCNHQACHAIQSVMDP